MANHFDRLNENTSQEIEKLIQRANSGDDAAMRRLLDFAAAGDPRVNKNDLFRIIRNRAKEVASRSNLSECDADDVAQDASLKIIKHFDRFEAHPTPIRYINRIARNTAIDFFRKAKSISRLIFNVRSTEVFESVGAVCSLARLVSALAALRKNSSLSYCAIMEYHSITFDRYGEPIILGVKCTQRELAMQKNLNVSTYKDRIQRGHKFLREQLSSEE